MSFVHQKLGCLLDNWLEFEGDYAFVDVGVALQTTARDLLKQAHRRSEIKGWAIVWGNLVRNINHDHSSVHSKK